MPEQASLSVHSALAGLVDGSARDARLVASTRADLGSVLTGPELRKVADTDNELTAYLAQAGQALTAADQAAVAWQKDLAEATKRWEASLAELARLHPDEPPPALNP